MTAVMLLKGVRVESSARLHLGFYNFVSDDILYGGFGVAISEPRVVVDVYPSETLVVKASGDDRVVVEEVARKLGVTTGYIEVRESIPRHVGLGSTTQLMLSTGVALSRIHGLSYTVRELAVKLGRGFVSGIGIACFEKGGFVVDSGRRSSTGRLYKPRTVDDLPKPVIQVSVPEEWYFIIVLPVGRRGLEDNREEQLLDKPEKPPVEIQLEIYRSFLLGILPGILNNDPVLFGKALSRIQELVGKYFSKHQGGVFCCRETEEAINILRKHGVLGYGQSSWGPVAYGLVYGRENASRIRDLVVKEIEETGIEARVLVARPRNTGARVRFITGRNAS